MTLSDKIQRGKWVCPCGKTYESAPVWIDKKDVREFIKKLKKLHARYNCACEECKREFITEVEKLAGKMLIDNHSPHSSRNEVKSENEGSNIQSDIHADKEPDATNGFTSSPSGSDDVCEELTK